MDYNLINIHPDLDYSILTWFGRDRDKPAGEQWYWFVSIRRSHDAHNIRVNDAPVASGHEATEKAARTAMWSTIRTTTTILNAVYEGFDLASLDDTISAIHAYDRDNRKSA